MYAIANVILGTILPWGTDDGDVDGSLTMRRLDIEYPRAIGDQEWTTDDEDAYAGGGPATCRAVWDGYFKDVVLESPDLGWVTHYHGASDTPSAFVEIELDEFDESDHFALTRLTAIAFTPEQFAEAAAKYEKIPVAVRALLPPFSVYILWSTS